MATKSTASASSETGGDMTPEERREFAGKLVDRFAVWSGVAGFIPMPVVDVVAIGGLQIQMLRRLSQIYGVPFSDNSGKAVIASLAGAMIPATSGIGAASMMKFVPILGTITAGFVHAGAFGRRHLRHRQGLHPAFCIGRHAARFQCAGLSRVRQGTEGDVGLRELDRPASGSARASGGLLIARAYANRSGSGSAPRNRDSNRPARPSRMLEAIVYLIFCALTGLCGIDRRMGFFGTFLLAIVTTPLVVLPVLLLTGPSRRMRMASPNRRTVVLSGVGQRILAQASGGA